VTGYFAVTIDVEPDCSPTWHYSNPLTFEGVRVGLGEVLQPLFARFEVRPTYLINNVVLDHEPSVRMLAGLDACELGAHLHPEFIGPQCRYDDPAGRKAEANQCFLPVGLELAKMSALTDRFVACFGRRPASFRAGRFSAGPNTIRCLKELGYRVDTSVTPHISWADPTREQAVDYRRCPEQPYLVGEQSLAHPDPAGNILEVPVSVASRRRLLGSRVIWLRPGISAWSDMEWLVRRYLRAYRARPGVVLNMMFHNVEVLPGLSRHVRTAAETDEYLRQLERAFGLFREVGLRSATLSEIHGIYVSQR